MDSLELGTSPPDGAQSKLNIEHPCPPRALKQDSLVYLKLLFCFALLPLSEHFIIHYVRRNNTDITFAFSYFDLITALFIFLILASKVKDSLVFTFQRWWLVSNLLLLGLLLIFLSRLSVIFAEERPSCLLMVISGSMIVIGTSPFIFIDFKKFLGGMRKIPFEICFGLLAGSSQKVYDASMWQIWPYLAYLNTRSIHQILKLFGYAMLESEDPRVLRHALFEATIEAPCSGLEGISFFIAAWSLILMFDHQQMSIMKIFAVYCLGAIYMLILNIIRITIFFMLAIWAVGKWGEAKADKLFINFFHSHIGWFLYVIGLSIFFLILFKTQNKQKARLTTS